MKLKKIEKLKMKFFKYSKKRKIKEKKKNIKGNKIF